MFPGIPFAYPSYMDMPQNQKTIASLILNYLAKHPEAMDTVEGITRWWLLKERIDQSLQTVTSTLNFLQQLGFIEVRKIQENEFYKLNKIKCKEIMAFLQGIQVIDDE